MLFDGQHENLGEIRRQSHQDERTQGRRLAVENNAGDINSQVTAFDKYKDH